MDWQGILMRSWTIGLVALGVAACAQERDEASPPAGDEIAGGAVDTADTPPRYTETIAIEGTPQEMEVVEYRSPADFPLGFTTVVPADMTIDYATSGRGDEIRFEAAFGGIHRPDAALRLVAFPAGTDTADVRGQIAAAVAEVGGTPIERLPDDWAIERYRVGNGHSGSLGVGLVNGRWYYLLTRYPPEFGDGMGPRVDLILRRWRWTGTGTPLRSN